MISPNKKRTRIAYRIEAGTGHGWTGHANGKVTGHAVFTAVANDVRTLKEARAERKRQLERWHDARIVKVTTVEHRKLIR